MMGYSIIIIIISTYDHYARKQYRRPWTCVYIPFLYIYVHSAHALKIIRYLSWVMVSRFGLSHPLSILRNVVYICARVRTKTVSCYWKHLYRVECDSAECFLKFSLKAVKSVPTYASFSTKMSTNILPVFFFTLNKLFITRPAKISVCLCFSFLLLN